MSNQLQLPEIAFEINWSQSCVTICPKDWRLNQYQELLGIYENNPLDFMEAVILAVLEDLERASVIHNPET